MAYRNIKIFDLPQPLYSEFAESREYHRTFNDFYVEYSKFYNQLELKIVKYLLDNGANLGERVLIEINWHYDNKNGLTYI